MTSEPETPPTRAGPEPSAPVSRIAFERLRERTDERELIVSGLLAFALLSVPGLSFDYWVSMSIHVDGFLESALMFLYMFVAGLS